MIKEKEILAGILSEFFKYYKYNIAIEKIRELCESEDSLLKRNWLQIKNLILNKEFEKGEAFDFISIHANLPLDENTDDEAYKWFNLFISNIESEKKIIEY